MNAPVRFARLFMVLAEVFDRTVTDIAIEAYWDALRTVPIEALEGGARRLVSEARFFPRPVEWTEAAADWMRSEELAARARRLQLEQSTDPPISPEDVHALVNQLGHKLGWPRP